MVYILIGYFGKQKLTIIKVINMAIQTVSLDKQILKELRDQQQWWEQEIRNAKKKLSDASEQLAKVNRLINVFEHRIDKFD